MNDIPPLTPYCVGPDVPESCFWSRKKLQAREQEIVARASRRFETVVRDHLLKAVWRPPNGRLTDAEEENSGKYCRKILSALRTGRYTLFPQPQVKSSDIGFQTIGKMRLNIIQHDESCLQKRKVAAAQAAGESLSGYSFIDLSEWLYTSPNGYISVQFALGEGSLSATANLNQCRQSEGFSASFEREYGRGGGGDNFSQLGFAVVEIDGRMHVAGGGKLWMDGPYYVWRDHVYSNLRSGYMEWLEEQGREWPRWPDGESPSEEQIRDLQGRVLAVYPLDVPWLTGDSSEPTTPGMAHGPCLWNLEE